MSNQPAAEIERRLDDAIEAALADASELAKVEKRRDELVPEARAQDEEWAAELTARLELIASRVPLDVGTFRKLIAAEQERQRTGRRRLAAHDLPHELIAAADSARGIEASSRTVLDLARSRYAVAEERHLVAEAVLRVYGTDRRERA